MRHACLSLDNLFVASQIHYFLPDINISGGSRIVREGGVVLGKDIETPKSSTRKYGVGRGVPSLPIEVRSGEELFLSGKFLRKKIRGNTTFCCIFVRF